MGESTLPCGTTTRERLEDMRGDEFKSWDAFLNYLGDLYQEYDGEYAEASDVEAAADGIVQAVREELNTDAPDFDDIQQALETIEERTGRIERTLEQLQG